MKILEMSTYQQLQSIRLASQIITQSGAFILLYHFVFIIANVQLIENKRK